MESNLVALATLVFFAAYGFNVFVPRTWLVITSGVAALVIALISIIALLA